MANKRRICIALSRAKSSSATMALAKSSSCDGSCAAVVIAAASVILLLSSSTNNYSSQAEKKEGGDERLDVYLMDRIAKKSYLNYHSTVVSSSQHHQQQQQQEQGTTKHQLVYQHLSEGGTKMSRTSPEDTRPKGVPSRLRLLTVDVNEFKRDAFQHGVVCQLPSQIFDSSLTFVDGVAPSKPMNKTLGHNERTGTRDSRKPILQKSLAKQLYYCHYPQHDHSKSGKSRSLNHVHVRSEQKKMQSPTSSSKTYPSVQIGAEILEASVLDLNPNNIRRFYTSTSKKYHYDPGKYTNNDTDTTHEQHFGDASGIADADEAENEDIARETNNNNTSSEDQFEEKDIDDPDYERTAPWNQYAWLEEMHLRIHGLVPFGAPMQRAHIISQWMYGRIYHQSIPISSSRGGWLSWLWWPSWSGSYAVGSPRYRTSWDGVDGEGESRLIGDNSRNVERNGILPRIFSSRVVLNRASNKPHAVICDGSALQRVPGSLRYLSKLCREAGVPLYILNDPRTWGSQTHSTLSDAIVDMRKSITENVIHHALDLREGTAFERGRFVGRLEKEVAWQAYDVARKTRDNLVSARRRLRRDKVIDWSELSEDDLLRELIDRKVITLDSADGMDGVNDGTESAGKSGQPFKCSQGFAGLCQRWRRNQKE